MMIEGPAAIYRIRLGEGETVIEGSYSDEGFLRISQHTLFQFGGRTMIAVTNLPNYLDLIDGTSMALWRRVRAFNPRPGSYTFWSGRMLKVTGAVPLPQVVSRVPGRVVSLSRDECEVGVETGEGILGLLRVQMEGKKEMRAADFARGQKGFLGSVLPLR